MRVLFASILSLAMLGCAGAQTIDALGNAGALSGTENVPVFQTANPALKTTVNAIAAKAPATTINGTTCTPGGSCTVGGVGGVSSINTTTGAMFLGGGATTNKELIQPGIAPWDPHTSDNIINQRTGSANVLRNSTFTSWAHYKFVTQDKPLTNPFTLGIASYTATIDNGSGGAGAFLTVASAPTGAPKLFQRVTDAVNFTTNAPTAVSGTVLNFASTTGIAAGMYVTDLTTPRAIAGNVKVVSTTSTTVTVNFPIGFTGNSQVIGAPGVGSGDVIAFSTVLRGTQIVGLGTCTDPWTVSCHYIVNNQQLVASETMQSAGGWVAEGVYVIPVGTAGTSSITCISFSPGSFVGGWAPNGMECTAGAGGVDDMIYRFPIDNADTSFINCGLYTGPPLACISGDVLLQPITFQIQVVYSNRIAVAPTLNSKNGCPLLVPNGATGNSCPDVWTNATTDLAPVTLPACNSNANTPVQCPYTYIWVPTGVRGGMEIEYHTNALTNGQWVLLTGMDLKQTPGATCAGVAPPCFQTNPAPLDVPEIDADIRHNARFAQLIGTGWEVGINPGNNGFIETAMGFATSTTHFLATWPLPTTVRCDVWTAGGPKGGAPTCPAPNIYFSTPGDYVFNVAGGTQFVATAMAVGKIGANSLQIDGTSSGMTAGAPGYVTIGNAGTFGMTLIDSAIIGD